MAIDGKPHPSWNKAAWSEESAEIHGLSHDYFQAEGENDRKVAKWFKAENNGIAVADCPEFEQKWFIRLLETDLPFPKVQLLDFDSFVRMSLNDEAAVERVYHSLHIQEPASRRTGRGALGEGMVERFQIGKKF
ncbi:hypothetical protein [Ruegeria sp. SCP11]|uniref:hypothetical protein n=1 Tax=Ruegeria sp. SCP11 TaxID=3141378 RepID=UPI00333DCA4A